MPDYLNPGSFNPNMDFRANPLSGALAGMNIADMTQILNRGYRDSDLSNQKAQHDFEMNKAEDPAKLAEFEKRRGDAQMSTDVMATGKPKEAALSKLDTEVDTDKTTQSANRVKRLMDTGEELSQINGELKNNPMGSPNDGQQRSRWEDYVKRMAKHGVTLPPVWDTQTTDHINAQSESYLTNLPHLREVAKIHAQGGEQRENTALSGNYNLRGIDKETASRERIAQMAPGRALEEAKKDFATGNASEAQKQLIYMDQIQHLYNPVLNSVAGKLASISSNVPKEQAAKITEIMREMASGAGVPGAPNGGGAKPADVTKPTGPQAGDVVKGYKFKGGDPSKKENWEKV